MRNLKDSRKHMPYNTNLFLQSYLILLPVSYGLSSWRERRPVSNLVLNSWKIMRVNEIEDARSILESLGE